MTYTVPGQPSSPLPLCSFQPASTLVALLPAGVPAGNNTITIVALIQDATGVTASSLPVNVSVAWPVLASSDAQAQLVGSVTGSAASAANSGDVSTAIQLVGGAAGARPTTQGVPPVARAPPNGRAPRDPTRPHVAPRGLPRHEARTKL